MDAKSNVERFAPPPGIVMEAIEPARNTEEILRVLPQAMEPMPDEEQTSHEPSDGDRMVARRAVIVTPKQAYFDWLVSMGDDGERTERMERESDGWPRVVLIPAFISPDDARLFFAEHVADALESILELAAERRLWPMKRDIEKFLEWFDVVYADTVMDQGHGKFYVESEEDFIRDDFHTWVEEVIKRGPPPPPILKVSLKGHHHSPEVQSRLDSVVLLARYFTWSSAAHQANISAGVDTLGFTPDAETELLDDLNEHHIATTMHWLASLAAVIDGWEQLGLDDKDVAECLRVGGDAASPGSYRNRLERVRSAAFRFQNDPDLVDETREFCRGETVHWASRLDSAFLSYFRGFLNERGPAMNWVFR